MSKQPPRGLLNNPERDLQTLGYLRFVKSLGQGTFALVKLAVDSQTGLLSAVKMLDKSTVDHRRFLRERKILEKINHENIVKLLLVVETPHSLFLVLEYAEGGELLKYCKTGLSENEARRLFKQLLSALDHLHSLGIVHRDLKAENVLLDADLNIKLADFGLGNFYNLDGKLETFCGSPPYAAPELFLGVPYTGPEVDVYAAGICLFLMLAGHLPFRGSDTRQVRNAVLKGHFQVPLNVSEQAKDLLVRMICKEPENRKSVKAFTGHSWLTENPAKIQEKVLNAGLSLNTKESLVLRPQRLSITQPIQLKRDSLTEKKAERKSGFFGFFRVSRMKN